jgi:hypothetical protein
MCTNNRRTIRKDKTHIDMLILILIWLLKCAPIIGGSYTQDKCKNVDINFNMD